ncbi:MAG: hypothetical protein WEB03_04690 [Nitriliruptor sp.]|uniref:hypothetical protein n=1 Tax=Nitriliruptor sp. TaxID=2448056 RepID=UPI0034A01087
MRTSDVVRPWWARLSSWEDEHLPGPVRKLVAHPTAVALLAAVVVVAAASVHLTRYPTEPVASTDGEVVAVDQVDQIGPSVGADLDAYIDERHEVLASLPEEPTRAVVSFEGLVGVDDLALVGEVTIERLQLWVPGLLEPVEVAAGADAPEQARELIADSREDVDAELAELEGLLEEDLGDPAFEQDYVDRLAELEQARDLADEGAVVFAAIVVAPTSFLQMLVDDPAVRAVDPGGAANATSRSRFRGILPTDRQRASVGFAM